MQINFDENFVADSSSISCKYLKLKGSFLTIFSDILTAEITTILKEGQNVMSQKYSWVLGGYETTSDEIGKEMKSHHLSHRGRQHQQKVPHYNFKHDIIFCF